MMKTKGRQLNIMYTAVRVGVYQGFNDSSMLCAADMQAGKVFIVLFRISSFLKNMSAPTTICLLVAASPTVSVAHSAKPSVSCRPRMKVAARSNFIVAVQVRNCIEFTGKTSSRVETSYPECSGCLVVKQGTSVVWKTGNDVSNESAASILKENKCKFL